MLRWRRVEISGGALLMLAALYYLDGQGVLPLALLACALHEAGHWLAIRALGAFNLLPAAQLDGGRVLWCALALLAGRARADRFVPALSAALAAGLVCGALALVWQGRGNLSLLLTALWLLAAPAAGNMRMERLG